MKRKTESPLSFLMVGIGDMFSKYYYHTNFVIFAGDAPVLIDCPDPLPKALYEAGKKSGVKLDMNDFEHIILTHLHGDHANGLESMGFFRYFNRMPKPVIHTIPEVAETMWEHKLKAAMEPRTDEDFHKIDSMSLEDYFELDILSPDRENMVAGMKINIRYTKHYVPCFGFKVEFGGRSLGYSSDTAFDPDHIEFLSGCDLIIHETSRGGHTPYEKLAGLSESMRQKMILAHIYDDFNIEDSQITVAEEGRFYPV